MSDYDCFSFFSDGWGAYLNLKDHGYTHDTVIHKDHFKV